MKAATGMMATVMINVNTCCSALHDRPPFNLSQPLYASAVFGSLPVHFTSPSTIKFQPCCCRAAPAGELRRMIVMGAYYRTVDHVEYSVVGPGGQTKKISMEEGRQWEGTDKASKSMENDWMSLLDSDDESELPEESKRTYEHAPWRKQGVEVTL